MKELYREQLIKKKGNKQIEKEIRLKRKERSKRYVKKKEKKMVRKGMGKERMGTEWRRWKKIKEQL